MGVTVAAAAHGESLSYRAEWRLFDAGRARLRSDGASATLSLQTIGFVAGLYKVDDIYEVKFGGGRCAASSRLLTRHGKTEIETSITYGAPRTATLEKILKPRQEQKTREVETPACVHEVLGALSLLRAKSASNGGEISIPITDGRKFANVRIVARERERIKTPIGEFETTRYEAFLLNGVVYRRKGKLFVWLTSDERRLPVQIRIQMPFYIGTVTLQLEKEEP